MVKKVVTVLFLISLALGTFAQIKNGVIEVSGKSSMNVAPNQVIFSLTVITSNSSFPKCLDDLNAQVKKLKSAIAKAGISESEIKTERFNVTENYGTQDGERKVIGHKAIHKLVVKIELENEKMKSINSAIINSGVDVKMSLRFSLSDVGSYKIELMSKAVNNAKQKAETLARAAGVELGEVKRITYGIRGPATYSTLGDEMRMPMGMPFSGDGIEVNPSDLNLREQVVIVYYIK